MTGRDCDVAIVGGGLAGGLIALALATRQPGLQVRLLEAGEAPGGNHRWSWFESDLTAEGRALMEHFALTRWDDGYDVRFPRRSRTLGSRYRSLASSDFAAGLARSLPAGTIRTGAAAASLDRTGVTLESGERIGAGTVIDCRGFVPTPHMAGGWQVFMGRRLATAAPHGVPRPVIMDATVPQLGGYRFVYVLPLGERDLFIEDTYYQDTPLLDRGELASRLDAYCAAHGWEGDITETETGVLPVVTGGDFGAFQDAQRIDGVGVAGARGGFGHPLTSYTLPWAVDTALAISTTHLMKDAITAMLEQRARHHWRATRFYRRIGAMLFGAPAAERWKVFERFYGLNETLIERFYAARSTLADKARVVVGKPPVPLSALTASQPPLRAAA